VFGSAADEAPVFGAMSLTVRPIREGDLPRLVAQGNARDRAHHEERSQMQARGEATYLVAWRDDRACGRVTLLHQSKYETVRELLNAFPEMNALEASTARSWTGGWSAMKPAPMSESTQMPAATS
jgi:hypothetical protein